VPLPEQHRRAALPGESSAEREERGRLDDAGRQRDESADRRDQAADLRDAAGDARDEAGRQRDRAADRRDRLGDERDQVADRRDRAGDERDELAGLRDRVAEEVEARTGPLTATDAVVELRHVQEAAASSRRGSAGDRLLNAADRRSSAAQRGESGVDRSTASADREAGDNERCCAGEDRAAALRDRDLSAEDRGAAHLDELTGAYRRGPGFCELERELARATRLQQSLAVVFVDVDGLKIVNDSRGHAAGDQMLIHVAQVLGSKVRSYDTVVRYGGDEFFCVMSGLSAAAAHVRLAEVNRLLHNLDGECSVSIGVAARKAGDTAADLVRRADQALYRHRAGVR
jgi:diguanylate cyclase (GGDEF)-like protein